MPFEQIAVTAGRWILRILFFYIVLCVIVLLIPIILPLLFPFIFMAAGFFLLRAFIENSVKPLYDFMFGWSYRITINVMKFAWNTSDNFTKEVAARVPNNMGYVFFFSCLGAGVILMPIIAWLEIEALKTLLSLANEFSRPFPPAQ